MRAQIPLLTCFVFFCSSVANSFVAPRRRTLRPTIHLFVKKEAILVKTKTHHDFTKAAASVFGNLRVPSALFAGAAAGSAFALPIQTSDDSLSTCLKSVYALLMISCLSCNLTSIVIGTLSISKLATMEEEDEDDLPTYRSLIDFLIGEFELEFTASRTSFITGLVTFAFAIGLRAWITFENPLVGAAGLGIIVSGLLFCFAFLDEIFQDLTFGGNNRPLVGLTLRCAELITEKAETNEFFAVALAASALTAVVIVAGLAQVS